MLKLSTNFNGQTMSYIHLIINNELKDTAQERTLGKDFFY